MSRSTLCVALVLAWSLSGCNCSRRSTHELAPAIEVHDVAANASDPAAGPPLANDDEVAFGPAKVGLVSRHSVAVVSGGDQVLKVQEPTLQKGTDFTITRSLAPCIGNSGDPHVLEVGECRLITLQIHPGAVGDYEDVLHIQSDDAKRPQVNLKVTAKGVNGALQVCISSITSGSDFGMPGDRCSSADVKDLAMDLGTVPLGAEAIRRRVYLTNVGVVDLVVDGVKGAPGDPLDFGVEPSEFRQVMHPGDQGLAIVVYRPTAIGVRNGTVTVTADDPLTAPVVIHMASLGDGPRLCLDPASLDFGTVVVGATSPAKVVSLKSCGTQPVSLTNVALEGDSDFQFATGVAPANQDIAAGDKLDVSLVFKPVNPGSSGARLRVLSSDSNAPIQFAPLTGNAVPPSVCKLEASMSTIDFGVQVQLTSVTRVLTLHNAGNTDCALSAESIDAAGLATRFFIATSPPPPFVMKPNALQQIEVGYQPQDAVGPDAGVLTFQVNDPSLAAGKLVVQLKGTPVATPECRLLILPAKGSFGRQLDFGVVAIGDKKTLPMTLKNIGTANCTIQKPAINILFPIDNSFSFGTHTPPLPSTIVPGATQTIQVVFQPTSSVQVPTFTQFFTVQTNENQASECSLGGSAGCKQVFLTGSGVTLAIDTVPAALDFGLVTVGCKSAQKIVTIYNVGGADVTLTGFAIDPATAPFSIVQKPATPLTLHPGNSTTVSVLYQPTGPTPDTAMLVISHNFSSGTSTVPLKGTGTTQSHQTDTFSQNTDPKTDVLWVIDNSGSMSDKQDYLGQNARTFIQQANASSNDYQVAVIGIEWSGTGGSTPFPHTSDSPDWPNAKIWPGQFFGNPKIIRRTDADPGGELAKNIRIGNCCADEAESGLEAAKTALTNPLLSDPAQPNSTFVRPDAKLAIIVLSDEEDQGASQTVQYYIDTFQQLKGAANTQLFSFHAIVGDVPNGCTATVNGVSIAADAGKRYMEAVTRSNGIFRSICTTDWGKIATDIGLDAFTARTQFFLTRTCDPTTLVVKVNGNPKVKGVDYDYDSASNSIIFRASSSPPAGATITADYDTACF